jgi:ABC-type transport system substrate-binding protein
VVAAPILDVFRELRHGAAFSDGHPISADDVLFSFAVALDSVAHPSVQDLLIQNGKKWEVTAPDSYTVVIRTPGPNGITVPTAGSVPIMPKHVLERAPIVDGTEHIGLAEGHLSSIVGKADG